MSDEYQEVRVQLPLHVWKRIRIRAIEEGKAAADLVRRYAIRGIDSDAPVKING